jgi:hypothetical protein
MPSVVSSVVTHRQIIVRVRRTSFQAPRGLILYRLHQAYKLNRRIFGTNRESLLLSTIVVVIIMMNWECAVTKTLRSFVLNNVRSFWIWQDHRCNRPFSGKFSAYVRSGSLPDEKIFLLPAATKNR